MLPSLGKLTRRQIVTLTLAAAVATSGVYQAGLWLAQLGQAGDLCIEAMGPFFPELPSRIDSGATGAFRKEGLAAFPDGNHFLKTVGGGDVYLYGVDATGVVRKLTQVPGGPYKHANVAVLDDVNFVIAYTSGSKAYARVGQLIGNQVDMGAQKEFADVPQAYENRIVYAIDRMTDTRFVIVMDVPATEPSPLQAIVGQINGIDVQWQTQRSVVPERYDPRSTGASFDVAGYGANDFIVAFADAAGGKYVRARVTTVGIGFRTARSLGTDVRSVDLASTFGTPHVVLGYASRSDPMWRVQAGEITITSTNEQFGPINVESLPLVSAVAVSWINDDTYVVALSDGKGVYLRQGEHGGSTVSQRIYVSEGGDDIAKIAVSGSAGVPGRAVISQSSAAQGDAGVTATYCPACGNGKQEVGEQCDDGNQANDDQCSNACESPTCDDGIVQIGEVCNNDVPFDDAPICDPRFCGNDQIDPGEQCDDGNNMDGDGCDPLCRFECDEDADCPSGECAGGICRDLCGNGVVDPPICVSDGGGLDCPPPDPNDLRIVYLPGDVFATGHANGDLNKDGKIDIVVAYYMGSGTKNAQGSYNGILEAYINQGNGTFAAKKFVANFQWNDGGGQRGLDVVDVDNDADGDVVVYDGASQGVAVYRNDNLTFTKTHTIPDYFAFYLSHGDVNKDGDPELGLVGFKLRVSGTYENSVFKAGPATTFVSPPTLMNYATGYDTLRFADMDNDGDQDLVISTGTTVSGSFGYALSVFLSNGDGTFADPVAMFERNANPNVLSMSIADANGDGKKDVALGENGNTIVVVLGDGRGGSVGSATINIPFHSRFVAFADPTGDGKMDLVFTPGVGTEGKNIWYIEGAGDGLSYGAPERFVTVSPPPSGRPPFSWNSSYYYNYDLKSADYDGDGRLDLSLTHALSSDGASVILFRSSIDGCVQIPPVVTCSQPEECDDGSQNGQPGKCTKRCTLCGNGVIDTVNNVSEQCDDGVRNGEEGSTCSQRCTRIEIDRLGCVGIGQCALVPASSDAPACQNASHCPCDPADPSCKPTHPGCVNNACVPTTDPFALFCTGNADCTDCPASNPNCHQQCNVIRQMCVATPAGACTDCDTHLKCVNQACTVVTGTGPNECTTAGGCPPPEERLGCKKPNQCALVPRNSAFPACRTALDCCDPADPSCKPTHPGCVNNACVPTTDPLAPFCDTSADCVCLPTDPGYPNCNAQCNVQVMQCEAKPQGSCGPECGVDFRLGCKDQACAVVPVNSPYPSCQASAECINDARLGCVGIGQCVLVSQSSTAPSCSKGIDCCDPTNPLCRHLKCENQQCKQFTGPGINNCTPNTDDCAPCPASNPNCHSQCNVLIPACLAVPTPGDECSVGGTNCGRLKCLGNQCGIVFDGGTTNECFSPSDCVEPPRLGCTDVGMCALVPASSPLPACNGDADCCDPADPSCGHTKCENQQCKDFDGPGPNNCSTAADCAPCPASNPNCHSQCNVLIPACLAVPTPGEACPNGDGDCGHLKCESGQCSIAEGPGANECDAVNECPKPCNDNNVCDQGETCTCFDCANDPLCVACDDDTLCEAGESCACGDCSAKPICKPRLGCTGVGQCTLVSPDSTTPACDLPADCCDPADPSCGHTKCENQQCKDFDGPGPNNCSTAADCAPCPASNPNCHSQCNVLIPACLAVPTPGEACPNGDGDCGHLKCVGSQCTAVPFEGVNECDSPLDCADNCGNGVKEPEFGEQCDDGNDVPDDACTNNCKLYCVDDSTCPCDEQTHECTGMCGNRLVDIGEACDEGPNNRVQPPELLKDWYCKALSCTISSCFDNGDNDHDQFTDNLDPGCWSYDLSALRPNRGGFLGFLLAQTSILSPIEPEEFLAGKDDEACPLEMVDMGAFCAMTCDPGDVCPNGDVCPENGICPPVCGNSIIDIDLGEQCDDGNLNNDDACTNQCRLPPCSGSDCPRCGDGVYQPELGEQCDGSDPPASLAQGCASNCRLKCTSDDQCPGTCDEGAGLCVPPQCGDGEVNQPWERCDDGDINNENECNNACQPTCNEDPDCESGRCDKAQEICYPTCGNLHIDAGEGCDDGNLIDNDACTNSCQFHCVDDSTCDCDEEIQQCRPTCGNGRIDQGEGCDDGNRVDRDACSNRCQVRCRPGTTCPGSQACPQNGLCPPPGFCGDGIVDGVREQCDDGNGIDTDNCSNQCRARCSQNLECPNGLLCVGEECAECTNSLQCDAGFCVDGHCRQALPICGNGTVEPGEVCDDGNADDADGCTATCSFPIGHACVSSAQCQTRLCQNSACMPCQSAGQCASGLRCSEGNCLFGGLQCGDGTLQAGEACDDGNLVEQDECTSACLRTFGESCGHASECASTICSGGSCTPCRVDAECSTGARCAIGMCLTNAQMALIPNICGNGMLEADEECDDGNNTYGDGCTPGCLKGNAPRRIEVAANMTVSMPFGAGGADGENGAGGAYGSGEQRLHAGAGDDLSDTGPATVAVMAAGAAAGAAWVRRRLGKKR